MWLEEIKEHQLEVATLEAVSSKDKISLKGEELEGNFGEEVGVKRKLADQHICSGGRVWEGRSERRVRR